MSYDFSHLSPKHTKIALGLVHRIEELSRDLELCSSDVSKTFISHQLMFDKHLLAYYLDPDKYRAYKEMFNL